MLELVRKSRFKKDFKKMASSGKDLQKLAEVLQTLRAKKPLEERYCDHQLTGNDAGHSASSSLRAFAIGPVCCASGLVASLGTALLTSV